MECDAVCTALGEQVTPERLERIIRLADVDGNGTIDLEEFLISKEQFLHHSRGTEESLELDKLVATFGTLDLSGSGDLVAADLEGLLSTAGGHLSKHEAEDIVNRHGTDGRINVSQFVDLCRSTDGLSWRLRSGFRAFLVIGGPGSGKGLLSERLIKRADISHVSSGDLLRREVESGSALGQNCAETMKRGDLLPSSTIMALLKKSMAKSGAGSWLALDGFPRSAQNCIDFERVCGLPTCAFFLDVPDQVL